MSETKKVIRKQNLAGTGLILTAIIVLAFFVRFINIDHAPPGVYPDEAVNGEDALRALDTGHFQWFYPANQGREGLMMNLIALSFHLFGVSILTLKLPSIIFGTLNVLGTYLLTKEMFRKDRTAILAAFFVAVSFWAINFSRISFRANMLPTILVFSFYFLFLGIRKKTWLPFMIGGFIFGIGIHTYIAFRIAPLVLIAALPFFIISYDRFIKSYWKHILVFLLFSILAAAPMFYTFYAHPEYFESRSSSISILSPQVNHGNLLGTALKTISLSLVKYNFWGDQNWRHNYPPYPILDPLMGIAFLFGLIYSIVRFFSLAKQRFVEKKKDIQLPVFAFLIIWFFVLLIPEFMTNESLPHALRAIGTLPVVAILAAYACNFIYERLSEKKPGWGKTLGIISIALVIFIGAFNIVKYHFFWANKIETARSFEKSLIDISDYMKDIAYSREIFVVTGNMQRVPLKVFNHDQKNISYLAPSEIDNLSPKTKTSFMIIMTEKNNDVIAKLSGKFPGIQFNEIKDKQGLTYYTLTPVK
jgi:4-amino-4-deoxy-L-arabinose transferase-like glycosyltransferase